MKSFYATAAPMFVAIVTIPFLVGMISTYLPGPGFLLFLVGFPLWALALLIGTAVWLLRGIRESREAENRTATWAIILTGPMMCGIVLLAAWPALFFGGHVGDLSRLALNHRHYERIVTTARANQKAGWYADDEGVTYSVDIGPPVRVAFHPAGILDNWSAIVFDPTGEMLQADGFDPASGKFRAPDRITKLFGGDLVICRRLWANYLSCSFT